MASGCKNLFAMADGRLFYFYYLQDCFALRRVRIVHMLYACQSYAIRSFEECARFVDKIVDKMIAKSSFNVLQTCTASDMLGRVKFYRLAWVKSRHGHMAN